MEEFAKQFWGSVLGLDTPKIQTYKKYDKETETVDGVKIVKKCAVEDTASGVSVCICALENGNMALLEFKAEKEAE
jgi:hypothetical protein